MTDDPDSGEYLQRLVDKEALAGFLEQQRGPAEVYEVEHLGEGHSNETLFVRWGDSDLVIRRPPPGEVASSAHDVLREYRVIDALQETSVAVPPTVAACDDHSILGSDFYIMDAVEGDVVRTTVPDRFATAEHRQRIGREFVTHLVNVHQVDYEAVGLGEFGYPDGFTKRQVDRWTEQFEWAFDVTAAERELPHLERVTEWLKDNVPEDYPYTLVHGDFKLDNVLFTPGIPPEIGSIFDWELSTLGDPFTDIGWMLSFWWDEKDPPTPSSTGDLYPDFMRQDDFLTRTDLVDLYEDLTGWKLANQRFYRVLAVYKLAALGEMFFRRYLEGNSDDPLYPKMEAGVPELVARAARILDDEEPL